MKLNLIQTKFVGLTMKLDLKAREYKNLCDKLERYKKEKINENDKKLYELLEEFQKNHEEIAEIKKQLKELENIKEENKITDNKKYSYENMFKPKEEKKIEQSDNTSEKMMIKHEENLWEKIKNKMKKIFNL